MTPEDARAFVAFDAVSRRLGSRDTVEYWKSAPYPLSFMQGYEVKRRLQDAAAADPVATADIAHALATGDGLLDPEILARYDELDPGNARLRTIATDVLDNGAWRLLWMPASLPYYAPRGPYKAPAVRFDHEAIDLLLLDGRPAGGRERSLIRGRATDDARARSSMLATP